MQTYTSPLGDLDEMAGRIESLTTEVQTLTTTVQTLTRLLKGRDPDDVLEIDGLQRLLNKPTRGAVYQWMYRNPDAPIKRVGGRLVASREAVERWLAQRSGL